MFLTEKKTFHENPLLLIPILSDPKVHWCKNRVSFAYLFNLTTFEEFLLGFHHNDIPRFDISILRDFLSSEVYVYRKKYVFDLSGIYDVEMVHWYQTNQRFSIEVNKVIRRYWQDFKDHPNVNDFIPIMKHLEMCREIRDKFMLQWHKFELTESFKKYQQISDNLSKIEKNGLCTTSL